MVSPLSTSSSSFLSFSPFPALGNCCFSGGEMLLSAAAAALPAPLRLRQQVQALTAEKNDSAKEVHGLLQQLKALQEENADVLKECGGLQEQVNALAAAEAGMRHQVRMAGLASLGFH